MSRFRHIAPAGTAISLRDLSGWLFDVIARRDRTDELKAAICRKYNIKHCFLMSSGRAALAMLFTMLKNNSTDKRRNEIILPSYTCYSLPAAVEISGLKARICDINPRSLSYDLEALKNINFSNVLAIVSANLYGDPDDLYEIEAIARENNIFFIDDAAQAMNAQIGNRYAGTFGDIGIYSLDKGKNITSIQGGILITNDDDLAQLVDHEISQLPQPNLKQKLAEGLKLIIYGLLLRPRLYWIPANIPALGLGKTVYTTSFSFTQYSPHLSSIATRLFTRIDEISEKRCANAKQIEAALKSFSGIQFLDEAKNSAPVCLRLVLLVNNQDKRKSLFNDLISNGIGASISYPKSISDLDEIRKFRSVDSDNIENGNLVAKTILTLPTMTMLTKNDLSTINQVFQKHMST